jgi:uncharacterized protein (DUF305 family)
MGMWRQAIVPVAGALTVLVVSAGCTPADSGREKSAVQTTSAAAASPATTSSADAEAHNNADVWFVRHMIPYHQQAMEVSDIVLAKHGVDPRVTELADQIKATHGPEIQQMQDWLDQWGNPPMPAMAAGDTQMPVQGGMPGVLSQRELSALVEANGADASRLFLTQLIAHHEGAIALAHNEIEEGQHPPTVAMARSIASILQQRIDTMKKVLGST